MLTIERRAMTAEERAALEAYACPPGRGQVDAFLEYLFCLVGCPVAGIIAQFLLVNNVSALQRLSNAMDGGLFFLGTGLGLLCGILMLRAQRRRREQERQMRLPYQRDLSEGQVDVMHCTISDSIELADIEEASSYFLDVGGGQVLFLNGQYLQWLAADGETDKEIGDDEDYEPHFPCREFNVVLAPHSKQVLDVQCLGPVLTPSRTLDPEDDNLEDIYFPQDGELLAVSLPTLIDDLRRLKGASPQ